MTNLDSIFKSRDITLPMKVRLVKAVFFLWSCMNVTVGLWRKLSTKELMLLNCGVGEDSWESLGLKEIQPVHSKGDQSLVFIGRTDAKAETPILWPPDAKSWLIGKRPWCWERLKAGGEGEDEMVGWHHQLDGREFEQALGFGNGQGGLVCCDSWGHMTDWSDKENIRSNDHS